MPPLSSFQKNTLALAISQTVALSSAHAGFSANFINVNEFTDNANPSSTSCNLRQAIEASNTGVAVGGCRRGYGGDVIVFETDSAETIMLQQGRLNITNSMTIRGPVNHQITIDGSINNGRVNNFNIDSGNNGPVKLDRVKVVNAQDDGIFIGSGSTVNIRDSIISGNTGNGITSYADGNTLSVERSTISGNGGPSNSGGGMFLRGTVTIARSTISGNTANLGGGLYVDRGQTSVSHSTITGNSANRGGGVETDNGTLFMRDSIISGNQASAGYEISQQLQGDGSQSAITVRNSVVGSNQISSYSYAVRSDNNSNAPALDNTNFIGTGDRQNTGIDDIIYTNLDYNGGLTPTHNLPATSPARNFASSYNCATTDQRNESRGDLSMRQGRRTCDVGAVERLPINQTIQVDSGCTLADAINTVNTNAPYGDCEVGGANDIITFENSNSTITLTEALPEITSDVTIQGNGNTIDANNDPTVSLFEAAPADVFSALVINAFDSFGSPTNSSAVEINDLTLTGSRSYGGLQIRYSDATLNNVSVIENVCISLFGGNFGGGIISRESILTLNNSSISNNECRNSNSGGGITTRSGILNINNSTVSNNISTVATGGIFAESSSTKIVNSTISGNISTSSNNSPRSIGGVFSDFGRLFISNSTISGNTGDGSGGLRSLHSNSANNITRIDSSIIAGNVSPGDFLGFTSAGNLSSENLGEMNISEGNGSISITNSFIGSNAKNNADSFNDDALAAIMTGNGNLLATLDGLSLPLEEVIAPLGDNGGPTLTHGLVQGSEAINAGSCSDVLFDQRGEPRSDGLCDIGAFEAQADEVLASPSLTCFVVKAANGNVVTFCL